MSSGPRKAIVVGEVKPDTTVSTLKFESTTDGTPNTFCELSKTEKDAAKSTANRTLFNLFFYLFTSYTHYVLDSLDFVK